MVPNPVIDAEHNGYGALCRKIDGGDQRLSHYAVELGDSRYHRVAMYNALGNDPQWAPEYVWGHVTNKLFNFSGPGIRPNHANLGRIRVQESRASTWQSSAITSCAARTGNRIVTDFNTIDGGYQTCSAEPSNVKTNGLRSVSENEYLEEVARRNPNLDLIRDAKITRIIFDTTIPNRKPIAIGAEGTFRSIPFSIRFPVYSEERTVPVFRHDSPTVQVHEGEGICPPGTITSSNPNRIIRRIVLLSTGAINDPHLLKLSGVGPIAQILKWNIPLIADLPAVGEYLKDATTSYLGYFTNATAADIGVYPSNSDLITSRPGGFVDVDGDSMLWLMTPSNFGTVSEPFVAGFSLTFEMTQPVNGSVRLRTPNLADYPKVDYAWNDATIARQVKFLKKARDITTNGGIADRFQFFQYFPPLSGSLAHTIPTPENGHVDVQTVNQVETVLRLAASVIARSDTSSPNTRVFAIQKAAKILTGHPVFAVVSPAELKRICWLMWFNLLETVNAGKLPTTLRQTRTEVHLPNLHPAKMSTILHTVGVNSMVSRALQVLFTPEQLGAVSKVGRNSNMGDDDDLVFAVRRGTQAVLHASGTARMTLNDPIRGVVDRSFDVYKITGLKVSGVSIMPYVPGAGGQTWAWISAFNVQNVIRKEYGLPQL